MEDVISDSLQARKLTLSLLVLFAVLATALSAAGVYGVMSYGVAQRTREIGIRMALGARGGDVTSMVLRDAGKIAGIGLAIGLVAALALTRFVAGNYAGKLTCRCPNRPRGRSKAFDGRLGSSHSARTS